jgi:hypothetical protein
MSSMIRYRRTSAFQPREANLRDTAERVAELSAEDSFRAVIKQMADVTPLLRSALPSLETQWETVGADARQMIWTVEAQLRRLLAAGSPQPKSVVDKVWAGFTNDVRVTIWEFAEASLGFLAAIDTIVANNDAANWERIAFNAPALSAMHQRGVAAMESGHEPLAFRLEDLRQRDSS